MSCRIPVSDIHNEEAVKCVKAGERVLVRSGSKTVGAIVSAYELKILREIERREDEEDCRIVEKIMQEVKSGKQKLYSLEEVKRELGLSLKKNGRK